MTNQLNELLEYLENNIDEQRILKSEKLHCDSLEYKPVERLPLIAQYPYPQDVKFQPFPHREIFDNPEKMLFNQFITAFGSSIYLSCELGDDLPVTIRPDFGCVLIPAIFGANVEQVEDNPPWIKHTEEKISYEQIIGTSINFNEGLPVKVAERYRFYVDVLKDYPRLCRLTNIVLPDLQGPFDNLELLRGSDVFIEMYSHRELFLKAIERLADVQIELAGYFGQYVNKRIDGFSFQHGFVIKGGILIRNDTSIMINPQMYDELIAPFDEKILKVLGGGIHSCGRVDNIVRNFISLESNQFFDFGQSEMNDVEAVYRLASQRKTGLTRVAAAEQEIISGNISGRFPTGVSLIFRASSFEQAEKTITAYSAVSASF
jgi:hypothetical protein